MPLRPYEVVTGEPAHAPGGVYDEPYYQQSIMMTQDAGSSALNVPYAELYNPDAPGAGGPGGQHARGFGTLQDPRTAGMLAPQGQPSPAPVTAPPMQARDAHQGNAQPLKGADYWMPKAPAWMEDPAFVERMKLGHVSDTERQAVNDFTAKLRAWQPPSYTPTTGEPSRPRGAAGAAARETDLLDMLAARAAAAKASKPGEQAAAKAAVTSSYLGTSKVGDTALTAYSPTTRGTSKVATPSTSTSDPNDPNSWLDTPKAGKGPAATRGTDKGVKTTVPTPGGFNWGFAPITAAGAPYFTEGGIPKPATEKVEPPPAGGMVGRPMSSIPRLDPHPDIVNPAWTAWKAAQTQPLQSQSDQSYTAGGKVVSRAAQDAFGGMGATPVPTVAPPKTITTSINTTSTGTEPQNNVFGNVLGFIGDKVSSAGAGIGNAASRAAQAVAEKAPEITEKAKQAAIMKILSSVAGRTAFIDPMVARVFNPNPVENMGTFAERQQAAQNRERLSQGLPPVAGPSTKTAAQMVASFFRQQQAAVVAPRHQISPGISAPMWSAPQQTSSRQQDLRDSGMLDSFGMIR